MTKSLTRRVQELEQQSGEHPFFQALREFGRGWEPPQESPEQQTATRAYFDELRRRLAGTRRKE